MAWWAPRRRQAVAATARARVPRRDRDRGRQLAVAARCRRPASCTQRFPRLAAIGAEGERRDRRPIGLTRQRYSPRLLASTSHDERGRRHHAALLGAELAAQPVGLQGGESEPRQRRAHPQELHGGGLAVQARGLEPWYSGSVRSGVSGQASSVASTIEQARQHLRARVPRVRMPALTGEFTKHMATAAREARLASFPGPAAISARRPDDRPGCLYHGFCNRGGCHISIRTRPR